MKRTSAATLTIFVLGLALTALPLTVVRGGDEWQRPADCRNVKDVVFAGGRIWCATTGGLAAFDPHTYQFETYSSVQGLGGSALNAIAADTSGGVWLAFENRRLERFHPQYGVTHRVSALASDERIQSLGRILYHPARGIFVATNRGLAHVTYAAQADRWVWLEEWTTLDRIPEATPVKFARVIGNTLWAGTEVGLAAGDLNSPSPLSWTTYTTAEGLADDYIYDVIEYQGEVLAATKQGISAWNGSRWRLFSRGAGWRMSIHNDTLWTVASEGVYFWNGSQLQRHDPSRTWIRSFTFDDQDRLWGGVQATGALIGGLSLQNDTSWVDYYPDGPVTNFVHSFAFGAEGNVYLTGGRGNGDFGLGCWDGMKWTLWTSPLATGRLFNYNSWIAAVDATGAAWLGSWGGGLGRFLADGSYTLYDYREETGRRLIGYGSPGGPTENYVLALAAQSDPQGNLWVLNRGAYNGLVLVCIPYDYLVEPTPEKEWIYFHRDLFNNYAHFDLLAIDGRGRKWIASDSPEIINGQGIYVFDDRGTLDNPGDDRVWGPLLGLRSGQVLSLKYDPAGYIWAGSLDGAYYISADLANPLSSQFTQIYQLRDVGIKAIDIDPSGNKWFGTDFGVTILAPDLFTTLRQITDEAPDLLPSPRVTAIGINPRTGWAYIGTEQGLAALRTPYRDFGSDISQLTFEPNPFNPNEGEGLLIFTGNSLAGRADLRIFTPDGRLVRKLNPEQAALGWDGRNDAGQNVAGGIYLMVAANSAGQAARGKVAVLWK
ncbi:MAG: hypothetical protein V2A61_03540 [Calditrichota bacterium]